MTPVPAPAVRCVVPRVIGIRLAVARSRIGRANCRVGSVRRARTKAKMRGKVIAQNPKAASVKDRGFKVKLVVRRR